jgi:hypothetical protein
MCVEQVETLLRESEVETRGAGFDGGLTTIYSTPFSKILGVANLFASPVRPEAGEAAGRAGEAAERAATASTWTPSKMECDSTAHLSPSSLFGNLLYGRHMTET